MVEKVTFPDKDSALRTSHLWKKDLFISDDWCLCRYVFVTSYNFLP